MLTCDWLQLACGSDGSTLASYKLRFDLRVAIDDLLDEFSCDSLELVSKGVASSFNHNSSFKAIFVGMVSEFSCESKMLRCPLFHIDAARLIIGPILLLSQKLI